MKKIHLSRMKLAQTFKLKFLRNCSVWVVPSFLLIALFIIAVCYESLLTHPLQMFELYHSGKMFLKIAVGVYYVSTTSLFITLARFEV